MKLKNKIYIFQILFTTILLSFIFFTYKSYETQYKNDLKEYISERTNLYKQQFISSYNEAFHQFDKQKELFRLIHIRTIEILKKDPTIKLDFLVDKLNREFHLQNIAIDIYLIDTNYKIYKTTYPKDLGFNLSIIKEAKEFLDKTTKDRKIYIADFVSTDPLNMEYKLYSYSYLQNQTYLELGFVDKNIFNNFKTSIGKSLDNSTEVQLYNITKTKNEYIYYTFSQKRVLSKKEFFKTVQKVPLNTLNNDMVLNSYINNTTDIKYKNSLAIVSTPLFQNDMFQTIGYNNIILKVKIDISSKIRALEKYKTIFYISIFVTLLLLSIIYIFINRYFTYPIEKIVESINNKRELKCDEILSRRDELSIIAKEYNTLLKSLNKEILSNRTLLEENKKFIADTVHQIRTPLTNIMMNSEMIKRSDTTQKSTDYIDQINASINMLTNSYEDLSYILSYDTIVYKPILLSISEILSQRVTFFSSISKVNFKEIISNIQENITFNINQIEIERLIDNNISNAVKYATVNKPITITLTKESNIIKLSFKTYGKAIVNPKKLFEKNYREDEAKRGLGLGLNMVKGICEKYNVKYEVTYSEEQNIFTYIFTV